MSYETAWDEADEYLDKAGQIVKVGDFIVYGSLLGRSAALKFGKVLSIKSKTYPIRKWDFNSNTNVETGKTQTEYSIRVLGFVHNYWWKPNSEYASKGTLSFPDRTLRIEVDRLPENVQKILLNQDTK